MKIEHKIISDILKIHIELPLAEYSDDQKIKLSTQEVVEIANNIGERKVISIIKTSGTIKNFLKNQEDKNSGVWMFELEPLAQTSPPAKRKRRKRTTTKKSTSQSTSIRGRISKIASEIEESS